MEPHLVYLLPTFPPGGGTGTLRMVKQIKYLSREGFPVTVFARRRSPFPYRDDSLVEDIPKNVTLHWVDSPPDLAALWFNFGQALEQYAPRQDRVLLVTTSPTERYLLLGRWFSWCHGWYWQADLRDPLEGRGKWMKQALLRSADLVTSAWPTDRMFPSDRLARTARWIPNAYDPEDQPDRTSSSELTRFIHTGTLYQPDQDVLPVLEAFKYLLEQGDINRGEFKLHLMGAILGDEYRKFLESLVESPPLSDHVTLEGFRSHDRAVQALFQADVGIICHDREALVYKFVEYLGADLPVVVRCPIDSALGEVAHEETGIHWVQPGDDESLRDTLEAQVLDPGPAPSKALRRQFRYPDVVRPLVSAYRSFIN